MKTPYIVYPLFSSFVHHPAFPASFNPIPATHSAVMLFVWQGSTIGIRRVRYVCLILIVCTWFWTCVRLDVCSFFSLRFFKLLKIFLVVMILYCLKSCCYIFDFYLFVLGRERFLTAYICLKETWFFSFSYISKYCLCFYYKIMKKLYMRTIIGSSGSDCFNYLISTLSL